jgi:hypothetical protein
MSDDIIQEVRDTRAALASEFDYDIGRIIAWAQAQEAAERESCRQNSPDKALGITYGTPASPVVRKRPVRPAGVPAQK